MRLTTEQVEAIRQRVQMHMGPHARIWLFGSRVDDSRRGGDIDLNAEPETPPGLVARLRCKSALADALDLNVDLIVQQPGRDLPIYRFAKQSGGGPVKVHLGKTMRSVTMAEERDVKRFGAVLAFMVRLQEIGSAEQWKLIRELRNAVNHKYEHDTARVADFFDLMTKETPVLFECFNRQRVSLPPKRVLHRRS